MKPYLPVIRHSALAFGAGLFVFLAAIRESADLGVYGNAAIDGALAMLAGLGVGVAKRASP